ncbi:MAG: cytochrome c biogenesis heme-transporting ATPase CcmA [Gammaproteobacteria bacterium]
MSPRRAPGAVEVDRLAGDGLRCERGERELFAGLRFAVESGEVLHVEGRNGAGKTTLLRLLCGLAQPDAGVVKWRGEDIAHIRPEYLAQLAYVGHSHGVKGGLTVVENLRVAQALSTQSQNTDLDEAISGVGLAGYEDALGKTLSAGQRRRAALARLLAADAPLWILDEPYTALDTDGVGIVNRLLHDHSAGGGMAVVSSHQAVEIDGVEIRRLSIA